MTYIGRSDIGRRFQNTEVLTFRGAKIVEAEVYFGWSLPHPALLGGFLQKYAADMSVGRVGPSIRVTSR
ncbi:MAG TPA: hypothetical protein VF886_03045 [Roseiarcus sp.]